MHASTDDSRATRHQPFLLQPLGILLITVTLIAAIGAAYAGLMISASPIGAEEANKEWDRRMQERLDAKSGVNGIGDLIAIVGKLDGIVEDQRSDFASFLTPQELEVCRDNRYESGLFWLPEEPEAGLYPPGSPEEEEAFKEWELLRGAVLKMQRDLVNRLESGDFFAELDVIVAGELYPTPERPPTGEMLFGNLALEHTWVQRRLSQALRTRMEHAIRENDAAAIAPIVRTFAGLTKPSTFLQTVLDEIMITSISSMAARPIATADPSALTLSEDEYGAIVSEFREPRLIPDVERGLVGEMLGARQMLDAVHTRSGRFIPSAYQEVINDYEWAAEESYSVLADLAAPFYPSRSINQGVIDEAFDLLTRIANEPDPAVRATLLLDYGNLSNEADPAHKGYAPLFELLGLHSHASVSEIGFQTQSNINYALVNLARARYHTIHGELPNSIDVLLDEGLIDAQTAVDPLTGKLIDFDRVHPDNR